MPEPIHLALLQLHVHGGERERNLDHALQRLAAAAAAGSNLVVLPEALPLGWTDPSAQELADAIPDGPTCRALRDAARELGVHVASGIVERAGDRVYNAAVLIDPAGEVLLHHRKLNELDIGHPFYAPGDRLGVADTALGRIGLMICADAFAADRVVTRTLGLMGARLIVSPSAWAVPADHDQDAEPYGDLWRNAYRPVCRDFGLWIAGVSNVGWIPAGPWAGRKCIGTSLVMDPDGEVAAQGPYGPEAEATVTCAVELRDGPRAWHHPPDRWFRPLGAAAD